MADHTIADRSTAGVAGTTEVACSLTDEELRERRILARNSLVPHITGVTKLDLGLRVTFPNTEALRLSVENFISLERRCCGFLNFTVASPEDELILTIDGPPESRATIEVFATALTDR